MYYIKPVATPSGNYGNPQLPPFPGALALPDALLADYIDSMGFVVLTVEDGTVAAVARNVAAYDAYVANHPPQPEPEDEPTADDILDALLGLEGGE